MGKVLKEKLKVVFALSQGFVVGANFAYLFIYFSHPAIAMSLPLVFMTLWYFIPRRLGLILFAPFFINGIYWLIRYYT